MSSPMGGPGFIDLRRSGIGSVWRLGRYSAQFVRDRPATVILPLGLLLGVVVASSLGEGARRATTYHIDCFDGSDLLSGTSAAHPWRSLSRASQAELLPGDRLLLRRGCTWRGPLTVAWNGTATLPINIGGYGEGDLPIIENALANVEIEGSFLVIEGIHARADAARINRRCADARVGSHIGFRLMRGAAFNVLRNSIASDLLRGIRIEAGAHHNTIVHNKLRDNDMQSERENPEGGVGIALRGDDNEVAYNVISGSNTCSPAHGWDGSAVEVFGGQRNRIHHNTALDNHNFSELGNARSADNVYAYNHVESTLATARFLTTRGGGRWGPVQGTQVYNNSVYLTGVQSRAVSCSNGCGPDILHLYNNVLWATEAGSADALFDEGHNIFWDVDGDPAINFAASTSSRTIDPGWIDPVGGNLDLADGSPAIDAGTAIPLELGSSGDREGTQVPNGAGVDIGAYEWLAGDQSTVWSVLATRRMGPQTP